MIKRDIKYEMPEIGQSADPNTEVNQKQLAQLAGLVPLEFGTDIFDFLFSNKPNAPTAITFPDSDPIESTTFTNQIFTTQIYNFSSEVGDAAGGSAKSVTLIVGPSSNADSDSYDYVTNGTADDVQIQAAIDALPSGGGMIVLREGTYQIATQVSTSQAGLSLVGMGHSTVLRPSSSLSNTMFSLSGNSNLISSLKFDGSTNTTNAHGALFFGSNARNPLVKGVHFSDMTGECITAGIGSFAEEEGVITECIFEEWDTLDNGDAYAINGWAGQITHSLFSNTSTTALYITISAYTQIANNMFVFPASYGIESAINLDISEAVVDSNTFYFNGAIGDAWIIQCGNRCIVSNNVFDGGGIGASSGVIIAAASRCIVSGNILNQTAGTAIELQGAGSVATGNVIDECGRHGIFVYGNLCSVTGNFIRGAGSETNDTYDSVRLEATVGTTNQCVVNGNTFTAESVANKPKYHINEVDGDKNIITSNATNADAVTGQININGGSTVNANNIIA